MKNTIHKIFQTMKEHKKWSITIAAILCVLTVGLIVIVGNDRPAQGDVDEPGIETEKEDNENENSEPTSGITRKEWAEKLAIRFGHVNSETEESYFSDVNNNCEYFVYVQSLVEQEVILVTDKFEPDSILSGKEMLTEIGRAFGKDYICRRLKKDELSSMDYVSFLIELEPDLTKYAVDDGLTVADTETMLDVAYVTYVELEYDNFAEFDYAEGVLVLTDNTYTVEGNRYAITSESEIKVGDVVLLGVSDGDPDGEAILVESVEVNGNVYTVSGSTPEMEDIFDEFEMEFSQIATEAEFTPAEGIEIVERGENDQMYLTWDGTTIDGGNAFADGSLIVSDNIVPTLTYEKNINYSQGTVLSKYYEFGSESELKFTKEYLEVADGVALQTGQTPNYFVSKNELVRKYTGGYNCKVGIDVSDLVVTGYACYKTPKTLSFIVNAGVTVKPEVELEGNATINYKLGTFTITIPETAGIVQLQVDVYCQIGINGDLYVTTTMRAKASVCKSANSSHISASAYVSNHMELEANCEVELLVGPDVTLKILGIKIVDAYVMMGVGGCTQYTAETPNKLTFSIYLPVIKAGVGMNDDTILTKKFNLVKDFNIMDREEDDPLINCLYRKDFEVELFDITDLETVDKGEVSYKIENGVLTFSGNGPIMGFDAFNDAMPPWFERWEEVEKIVIEEGVTAIGYYALSHMENVKEVIIADSVTFIAEGAFYECYGLEKVQFPANLTEMGNMAFHACESLKSIEIHEGLTKIPEAAFSFCISLESVELPSTITEIEASAFEYCEALTTINIPDGVIIAENAFEGCTSLENVPAEN